MSWRYFHIKKSLKKQKTELNRQIISLSETSANYKSAKLYYKLHKNLNVPVKYTDTYGVRLGAWLARWLSNQVRRLNETDLTEKGCRKSR